MNKRSRQFLTVLMCTAIFSNCACSTTTQRLGPTQAAMNHHGIGKGDTVLIRYANESDRRSSSRSEIVQITNISDSGITGVGESGRAVNVGFTEIFQFEYKNVGLIDHDGPTAMVAGKALNVTAVAAWYALCVVACGP